MAPKEKALTEEQLVAAAEELNDVLGIDPPIDVEETGEIEDKIKEAVSDLITPDDEFSEATKAVLLRCGWEEPTKKPARKAPVVAKIPEDAEPEEEVKKPAAKAPAAKASATAVTKERFAAKKSTGAERIAFYAPLIKKGTYTKAELVAMGEKEFPDVSPATLVTMLTDAKNPKYNKFDTLVVQGEDGVLKFKK